MSHPWKTRAIVGVLCLSIFASGCYGPFNMPRRVHHYRRLGEDRNSVRSPAEEMEPAGKGRCGRRVEDLLLQPEILLFAAKEVAQHENVSVVLSPRQAVRE